MLALYGSMAVNLLLSLFLLWWYGFRQGHNEVVIACIILLSLGWTVTVIVSSYLTKMRWQGVPLESIKRGHDYVIVGMPKKVRGESWLVTARVAPPDEGPLLTYLLPVNKVEHRWGELGVIKVPKEGHIEMVIPNPPP